jgi:translation initiation factor IF-2
MINKIKQIIKGYYQWIKYQFNKEYREKIQKEAQKRIKICELCDFFWKPGRNCMICGCFCDIKTKGDFDLDENGISRNGCPEHKW